MSTLDLPELKQMSTELASLRLEVAELRAVIKPDQEWFTLRQCAAMKRGYELVRGGKGMVKMESFYSTLRTRVSLRPPGEPREVGGRLCWHRSVLLPWLAQDDSEVLKGPARAAPSTRRSA